MANYRNRIVGHGEVDPEQLLANPRNWRIHPKAQQESLEGVLEEVGWVDDIIVNQKTGYVLDGHLRVSLSIRNGETLIPVKYVDLSEDEERLILATIDPIAGMAVADKEMLEDLLAGIETESDQVKALLDDIARREKLNLPVKDDPGAQMDRAEELQEKWQVERGQIWQIGEHRLMCGDSTSEEDVGLLMGGEKAQIVFTDPPYGVDYDGGTTVRDKLAGDDSVALYEPCCKMAFEFSDTQAPLYLWHAGVKGIAAAAAAAAAAAGYEIRCELIWNKNLAQYGALSAQYKQKHEPCYYCFKRGTAPRWFGPTNEVTVWDVDRSSSNDFHPTQKPVDLAIRAVGNSSERNDIVMDLFLGGGTTMVAAQQLNRICYSMEIEPKYCAVTLERMSQMGLEAKVLK